MKLDFIVSIGLVTVSIASVICIVIIFSIARVNHINEQHKERMEKLKAGGKLETCLEKPEIGTITVTEQGLCVSIPKKKVNEIKEIEWNEIDEIIAFKKDLFAVDLICWQFYRLADEYFVEVNEEMVGYKNLLKTLGDKFDIKEEDWFRKVAIPPFATNLTTVWKKTKNEDYNLECE